MGKGDKKTKRGKIILGSYGVSRPRKKRKPASLLKVSSGESVAKKMAEKPKPAAKEQVAEIPAEPLEAASSPDVKSTSKPVKAVKSPAKGTEKKAPKAKSTAPKETVSSKTPEKTEPDPETIEEKEK